MYGYIYITTNLINGKQYIGQHKCSYFDFEKYKGSGKNIWRAFKKYGKENFKCELLESVNNVPTICNTREELNKSEKYYIKYYNCVNDSNYYNLTEGGLGGDVLAGNSKAREKAIKKHQKSMSLKPKEELESMYKHHGEALRKTYANYTEEQKKALAKKRSKIQKEKYKNEPEYRKMRAEINRLNASKQAATQNSKEWIETIGKDSHRRQNIHVAKTFYLDSRTQKLYTLSAVAELLNIPKTLNVRKQLIKYYPFILFIESTFENDKLYNFLENVITACYSKEK